MLRDDFSQCMPNCQTRLGRQGGKIRTVQSIEQSPFVFPRQASNLLNEIAPACAIATDIVEHPACDLMDAASVFSVSHRGFFLAPGAPSRWLVVHGDVMRLWQKAVHQTPSSRRYTF